MTTNEKIELTAIVRKPGKSKCRSLRNEKMIPAVVYGPKTDPLNIAIEERLAVKYANHRFENTIFTLKSDEKTINGQQVIRKDLSVHPLSRKPRHIDFYALDMTQTVQVNVELNFTGKPEGVKNGGVFNAVRREIEIECLPIDIPEKFDVDVSTMEIDDNMHVSDLNLGDIKIITASDLTICTVAEVKEEEVDTEAAEAAAAAALADPDAPAGEGGEKKAGEGGKKPEGGGEKKAEGGKKPEGGGEKKN